MTTNARRRLLRDFRNIRENAPAGIQGAPTEENLMFWNAVIFGFFIFLRDLETISAFVYFCGY
jgi:hypothetical protein